MTSIWLGKEKESGKLFMLSTYLCKSERQRLQNKFFLSVRNLPTQIGVDGVRNSKPRFSCLGPFKYSPLTVLFSFCFYGPHFSKKSCVWKWLAPDEKTGIPILDLQTKYGQVIGQQIWSSGQRSVGLVWESWGGWFGRGRATRREGWVKRNGRGLKSGGVYKFPGVLHQSPSAI